MMAVIVVCLIAVLAYTVVASLTGSAILAVVVATCVLLTAGTGARL